MTYNQTKVNGVAMPLLMGCTKPTAIEVAEDEPKILYNPITQIVEIECGRAVGTKCLKTSSTVKNLNKTGSFRQVRTDKKNEIDDTKYV